MSEDWSRQNTLNNHWYPVILVNQALCMHLLKLSISHIPFLAYWVFTNSHFHNFNFLSWGINIYSKYVHASYMQKKDLLFTLSYSECFFSSCKVSIKAENRVQVWNFWCNFCNAGFFKISWYWTSAS